MGPFFVPLDSYPFTPIAEAILVTHARGRPPGVHIGVAFLAFLALRSIHPFTGFGIRFRLLDDTRVNLRFDWGFGDNSSGNYVGVNEAF